MGTALVRLVGLAVVVATVVALPALGARTLAVDGYSNGTIYPWWSWALVVTAGSAGAALVVRPSSRVRTWAGAVTLVGGLQLLGTGIVAVRHWRPAIGIGVPGDSSNLPDLVRAAAVLAVIGLITAVAGAVLVRAQWGSRGAELPTRVRLALVAAAVAFILVVPLLVVLPHPDLMSWGAAGLMHAGPWAVGLLVAAYSRPPLARALCMATAASALFAVVGPNMFAMGLDSRAGWLPALLLALAAVAVVLFGLGPGGGGARSSPA